MGDLTIIFLTVNKVPKGWAEFQKETLLKAAKGLPIITISREPMDWGQNLIQEDTISSANIYRQVLRGAKTATTPYIAVAEDDVLYNDEHFANIRPPMDTFGYNMYRWGLNTWGHPTYFWKDHISNAMLIAPRELAIEALEERFAKHPGDSSVGRDGELGKNRVESRLGLTLRKFAPYYTTIPLVYLNHKYSIDPLEQAQRKRMGIIRAFDIPLWGRAEDVVKKFI
jgi:hypothetical protein